MKLLAIVNFLLHFLELLAPIRLLKPPLSDSSPKAFIEVFAVDGGLCRFPSKGRCQVTLWSIIKVFNKQRPLKSADLHCTQVLPTFMFFLL
eukprot:Skav220356  [mRNA]  locus=scaffold609:44563:55664:- [translate_table: standard]